MKFLAIDPSSTELGWAISEDDTLLKWGIISTSKVPYERRFLHIITEMKKLLTMYGFTEIACERAIRFSGRRIPALEVAVMSLKKWAEMQKLPIAFYSPSEWKRSVVGTGRADKDMVARAAYLRHPELHRELRRVSNHVTDAVCIGAHHYGVHRLEIKSQGGN